MNVPKMTAAGSNPDIPAKWYFRIGKLNSDEEEIFCVLNDMDMLIAQQNDVVEELLEDTSFGEELAEIRARIVKETYG